MKKLILAFAFMSFFSSLFSQNKKSSKDEFNSYTSTEEDTLMIKAIEKANKTMGYFIESLQNPKQCQTGFNLKLKLTEGDVVEHIWLGDIELINSKPAFGLIENDPFELKLVKFGMRYPIDTNLISDWMIIESGRLIGGYTNRCYFESLNETERKKVLRNLNYTVDEGVDYYKHDHSSPEGAILCLEDAYNSKDLDKVISCVNFEMEAIDMLMIQGFKRSEIDTSLLNSQIELGKLMFTANLEQEGFPTFDNLDKTFPNTEIISENIAIITEVCHYPDGHKTKQRLKMGKQDGLWKFISPAN